MSKGSEDDNLFSRLTLGVVKSLEKRPGVCDVVLEENLPVEKHILTSWEQKYSCLMPDDVKCFYLTTNGFKLRWSTKMNDTRIPVGRMEINPFEHLVRIGGVSSGTTSAERKLPSLSDICGDNEIEPDSKDACRPRFDHRSRIFELDPCDGYGKVCLVYNNTKPDEDDSCDEESDDSDDEFDYEEGIPASKADIWFLDRSLQWHHLADDFISYYRLLLMHIGLPHWQYAFTDIGLPPQAKQWFNMYAPMRLDLQHKTSFLDEETDGATASSSTLDVAKVFKGKTDKKKIPPAQKQLQKRPGAPSAKSQTFMGRTTTSTTQQPKSSAK